MPDAVEFLNDIVGLSGNQKIELRLLDAEGQATSYFFRRAEKAVEFAGKESGKRHVFFGAAPRKSSATKGRKADVAALSAVWIDLDRKGRTTMAALRNKLDQFLLPPSYIVFTGGGYHAYWRLREPVEVDEAENVLKALQLTFKSDNVSDAGRVLRVPGTLNIKYKPTREVVIEGSAERARTYAPNNIKAVCELTPRIVKVIITGDATKYKSRSERDFAVMADIVSKGGDLRLVKFLFGRFPVGDAYEEKGVDYLERTHASVVEYVGEALTEEGEQRDFIPFENRYWYNDQPVSTFVLTPTAILHLTSLGEGIVCDVTDYRGITTKNVMIPRRAFNRGDSLNNAMDRVHWMWMGTDLMTKKLLTQLQGELSEADVLQATSVIGRHGDAWVAPGGGFTANGELPELQFVSQGEGHPPLAFPLELNDESYKSLLESMLQFLPYINRPEALAPSLFWHMAAIQKTALAAIDVRFPHLMLFGTRGSGKTSLVEQVFQRMVGYTRPMAFDCDTTQFALLTLFGTTNSIPVSLKEFRSGRKSRQLLRYLREAYDLGMDRRGQKDQTVRTYPLLMPVVLDGEDAVEEPANLERMIIVNLVPEHIIDGTTAYRAFQGYTRLDLRMFPGRYVQFCLGQPLTKDSFIVYEREARALSTIALPARIMSNFAVLCYGRDLLRRFLGLYGLELPPALAEDSALIESLGFVFSTRSGRTSLGVDGFVEDLVNEVAAHGGQHFNWRYEPDDGVLWVHLKSAYNWWLEKSARRGSDVLSHAAIRQQLKERQGEYVLESGGDRKYAAGTMWWMWPLDLARVAEMMDTPEKLQTDVIVMKRGGK